jgi:DNA modification methylase
MNDDRADWREAWALFEGDVVYVWHAGCKSPLVAESLIVNTFDLRALICWAKEQGVLSRGHYHHQHEPCWYGVRKSKTARWSGDRTQTTLWRINKANRKDTGHSTQKPLECMARPIQNHGGPDDDVYDPFLGSGTTLIAAEQLGRKCYGMEISPQYCDVIVKRWETLTGQKATLQAADQSASTGAIP